MERDMQIGHIIEKLELAQVNTVRFGPDYINLSLSVGERNDLLKTLHHCDVLVSVLKDARALIDGIEEPEFSGHGCNETLVKIENALCKAGEE